MDDENTKSTYGAGGTVEWVDKGEPVTGTFLYMGGEGNPSSGIYTYAYVVRHTDRKIKRILPTRLTFQ